jgi:hypothetical protein
MMNRLVFICFLFQFLFNKYLTQNTLNCPSDWVEFKGTVSCYKFQRYPLMNINDAKSRCATDGAYLLAVESITEHMFIQEYLKNNDIEQRRWYTSGESISGRWTWSSTKAVFNYEQGFLDTKTNQFQNIGQYLTYAYECNIELIN